MMQMCACGKAIGNYVYRGVGLCGICYDRTLPDSLAEIIRRVEYDMFARRQGQFDEFIADRREVATIIEGLRRLAASAMSARQGQDAEERLGAEPASAVGESRDAQPLPTQTDPSK